MVQKNLFPLSSLFVALVVLSFWQFRHAENPLARRVFSVGNPNDFSWRNRVATWSGAAAMMKDRPWAGHGWGKAEAVLGEKYKPVRLEDAAAIRMNDYLMLGISCGVPALLCFVAYSFLSVRRGMGKSRGPSNYGTTTHLGPPHEPPPHPASGHPLPIRWGEGWDEGDASSLSSINSQL